jgi:aspartate beta-hydroxylase
MISIYDQSVELIRKIYDKRITTPAVLESAAYFPHAHSFVDRWETLRQEALRVANNIQAVPRFHELLPSQAEISANDDRDWRMFVLKAYGVVIPQNMVQCPSLAALIGAAPEVLSATLSYLAPGKHIPQHRGPFRGVIRFYLGLSVATAADNRPSTVLMLNGVEHLIGNGGSLLWDDTFPHEVWNNSDTTRIALLLDIRRCGMPRDLTVLSRLLIGAAGTAVRCKNFKSRRVQ